MRRCLCAHGQRASGWCFGESVGMVGLCRSDETYMLISAKDELLFTVAEDYKHPVRCPAGGPIAV